MAVCEGMRYYPRPGNYCGVPCFLPGSADGFPRDEAGWLRGVEGVWMVGKGRALYCLAAVLEGFWEKCAKAREREETGDKKKCIMYE